MVLSHTNDDYPDHFDAPDFYGVNGAEDDELDVLDDYAPSWLEYSGTGHRSVDELDALDNYEPDQSVPGETTLDDIDVPSQGEDGQFSHPQFTVTNPAGTVSVSALMDGSIYQIELSAEVGRLAEAELEAEIIVIADLAQQHAKSAQHRFILDRLQEAGATDQDEVRDFLREGMHLPTQEEVAAAQVEVFSTRYRVTAD